MNVPNEFLERCETLADSGGAGLHRGGNGIDMVYRFLEAGMIAIHVWRTPATPLAIAAE